MASFKESTVKTGDDILLRQKGKPVIYVEGESDKRVFEQYWFVDLLERISFKTAPDASGCSAVVRTVSAQRLTGLLAFGIVDRDKLMADENWSLLLEADDAVFDGSWHYPSIKVTKRWELESYLIEPEALEAYLAPAQGGRPPRSVHVVEGDLLTHANALVPFAALNQAMHRHRIPAPKDGYTALDSRERVEVRIASEKLVSHPQITNDYHAALPHIDAFAGSPMLSVRERLEGLLRIINGKAMLDRIKRGANLKDDFTFSIAREIKQRNIVPAEIADFVQACCVLQPSTS